MTAWQGMLSQGAVAGSLADSLRLQGFGTLGAVHSSQSNADVVGTFFQPDGAGYSRTWAASVDSKLGVQLDARLSPDWSAVVQLVSQYNVDGNYQPAVEWANLRYQLNSDLSIRLGRIVAATFMESDSRLVGYAYPGIRPPQELYGINPVTNKDGVELIYQRPVGVMMNTLQVSYGQTTKDFPSGGRAEVTDDVDIQYVLEYDATQLRLGYTSLSLAIDTPATETLFAGLSEFGLTVPGAAGQQATANARDFSWDGARYTIMSAGISHNAGDWLLRAEWAWADIAQPAFASDVSGGYLMVGYHFATVMPYLTVAQVRPQRLPVTAIPVAGLDSAIAPAATLLNTGLTSLVDGFAFSQKSVTVGVRWDVARNMDIKFELQHLQTGSRSTGRLANAQRDFNPGDSATVVGLAVDFVF